jgi:threonine dehydrogenase-like Zn-dependent dehydrogenase
MFVYLTQVGDAVALEPGVPCCNNVYTREGRYNLDPDIRMFATPPNHGALAQACASTMRMPSQTLAPRRSSACC